jgi:hypothetical protein
MFTARGFFALLYCVFLTWHFDASLSEWRGAGLGGGARALDITRQDLDQLRSSGALQFFRDTDDLATFLTHSPTSLLTHSLHVLVAAELKPAGYSDDTHSHGERSVWSRAELCSSMARALLPSLLRSGAYPLLLATLEHYTLLQLPSLTHSPDHSPFGFNSVALVRFRSRREFVRWLVAVSERESEWEADTGIPLRAYRSLLWSSDDASECGSERVERRGLVVVPLQSFTSVVLDTLVAFVAAPMLLLGLHSLDSWVLSCFTGRHQ